MVAAAGEATVAVPWDVRGTRLTSAPAMTPGLVWRARCQGGSRWDRGRWPAGWPRTGPATRRASAARPRCAPRCHQPRPCSARASCGPAARARCRGGARSDRGRWRAGWPRTAMASRRARPVGPRSRTRCRRAVPHTSWPGSPPRGRCGQGRAAGDGAARFSVLVRVTSVLLVVRVFARAGRTDPVMPTATRAAGRMLQASTTHADFVHVRMVLSLSFRGDQRRPLLARAPKG